MPWALFLNGFMANHFYSTNYLKQLFFMKKIYALMLMAAMAAGAMA